MNEQTSTPPASPNSASTAVAPQPTQPSFASAWSLFKPSAGAILRNFWTIVGLAVLPTVMILIGIVFALAMSGKATAGSISAVLAALGIGTVLFVIVAPAITLAILHGARGEKVRAGAMLRAGKPLIWRYFCLNLLLSLIFVVGLILLIVPYFFFLKRYLLAPYYLIDENLGVKEAMRKSAKASRIKGALWGIVGVNALFFVVGLLPLLGLIGSIASLVYSAAAAVRYLQIRALEAPNTTDQSSTKPSAPFAQQFNNLT